MNFEFQPTVWSKLTDRCVFSQGPVGAPGTGGFPGLRVSVIGIHGSQWRPGFYVILMHTIYFRVQLREIQPQEALYHCFGWSPTSFLWKTQKETFSVSNAGGDTAPQAFSSPLPAHLSSVKTRFCISFSLSLFWYLKLGAKSELGLVLVWSQGEKRSSSITPRPSYQDRHFFCFLLYTLGGV